MVLPYLKGLLHILCLSCVIVSKFLYHQRFLIIFAGLFHTLDISFSCKTMVVCLKDVQRFSFNNVLIVMTLMATPKSIKFFGMCVFLICTFVIGFLGSEYLGLRTLPNIRFASFIITLKVGGSFFLLRFLYTRLLHEPIIDGNLLDSLKERNLHRFILTSIKK